MALAKRCKRFVHITSILLTGCCIGVVNVRCCGCVSAWLGWFYWFSVFARYISVKRAAFRFIKSTKCVGGSDDSDRRHGKELSEMVLWVSKCFCVWLCSVTTWKRVVSRRATPSQMYLHSISIDCYIHIYRLIASADDVNHNARSSSFHIRVHEHTSMICCCCCCYYYCPRHWRNGDDTTVSWFVCVFCGVCVCVWTAHTATKVRHRHASHQSISISVSVSVLVSASCAGAVVYSLPHQLVHSAARHLRASSSYASSSYAKGAKGAKSHWAGRLFFCWMKWNTECMVFGGHNESDSADTDDDFVVGLCVENWLPSS